MVGDVVTVAVVCYIDGGGSGRMISCVGGTIACISSTSTSASQYDHSQSYSTYSFNREEGSRSPGNPPT